MSIIHDSIVDGEGLRTVVFFAGCPHRCKGCHNPESWNINNGVDMTVEEVFNECMSDELSDVTLSGGDPFFQIQELTELVRLLHDAGKNIWLYTGFTYEDLQNSLTSKYILNKINVLVDGKFELDKRDISLYWRGSSNQRVLKLDNGKIIAECNGISGKWE